MRWIYSAVLEIGNIYSVNQVINNSQNVNSSGSEALTNKSYRFTTGHNNVTGKIVPTEQTGKNCEKAKTSKFRTQYH
ncbi:hypothetical protein GCM10007391_22150 [Alteromonas halophila]|uniref:Uncharacterized protein n=1 Tax=Alteromonas halophila TaxID=516698 RepID=A0A918MYY3_9ALTE|nr:hypothetical protein GCM10007391_22150 [Alteromonas halophila]